MRITTNWAPGTTALSRLSPELSKRARQRLQWIALRQGENRDAAAHPKMAGVGVHGRADPHGLEASRHIALAAQGELASRRRTAARPYDIRVKFGEPATIHLAAQGQHTLHHR